MPGTCVTVTMEGRRPLLAELQALAGKSSLQVPRRTMHGVDSGRLAMVLAVLERRAKVRLHDSDVYVSTVGGARVVDPSADLAAAVAVASSALDVRLTQRCVAIGEVGLAGELRRVPGLERRLAEAARLGFTEAVIPVRRAPVGADRDESPRSADPCRADRRRRAGSPGHSPGPGPPSSRCTDDHHPDRATTHPRLLPKMAYGVKAAAGLGRGTERSVAQDGTERSRVLGYLALVAPGTPLRDGFERILRGRTGALVVLGHGREVQDLCTGGFELDVPFTPTALRELAKMDGAIVLDARRHQIMRAGVHLMPDAVHLHRRDRHPAPDGRPGRPADRRTGDRGLGLDGHDLAVRGRVPPVRREPRPDPRPGQPGAADPGALPVPACARRPPDCRRSRSRTR